MSPGGAGAVGEKGSVCIDSQSLDLVKIEAVTDEIPPISVGRPVL